MSQVKEQYIILSPVRLGRKVHNSGTVYLTEAEARWEVAAGRLKKQLDTAEKPASLKKK